MAKWIIGVLILVGLGVFAWHSGWFGNSTASVAQQATTTPQTDQQATTTPQDTSGLPTSQTDTSDSALAQDTAAVDLQSSSLVGDLSTVSQSLNDLSLSVNTQVKADQEIARRGNILNDLLNHIQSMVRVSTTFKQNLAGNTQNQIQALSALKAKIDADTDPTALKADLQTLQQNYRTFVLVVPQGRISASADRVANMTAMMQGVGIKLQARLQTLAASGVNITQQGTVLNDLGSKITDAQAQAQSSITVIAPLTPDNNDKNITATNTKAFVQAKTDLSTAQKDLVQARKDISSILKFIATAHATSTPATSTSVSL